MPLIHHPRSRNQPFQKAPPKSRLLAFGSVPFFFSASGQQVENLASDERIFAHIPIGPGGLSDALELCFFFS